MILNMQQFNTYITYCHFKMESINQIIEIARYNMYMVSIDLKDAFYSIPIHSEYQNYLSKICQYTSMPNGNEPAMHIFTKLSKVLFSHLRSKRFISAVFVDDSYLQGNTYEHVFTTLKVKLNYDRI